jgi:signal transduction histidine kinase
MELVRGAGKAREVHTDDQARPGGGEAEEFMSVAAHDLRNPIAVVRASAQMAQRQMGRGDTDAARVRLAAIVEQTDRLTELIEMFLDAARISAGRLPLQIEPSVDLRNVVDVAVSRAQLETPEFDGRSITTLIPERCIGAWDRVRLVRAMRALVSNALLYGDMSEPVHVEAECAGSRVRVRISGGGRGPDADEQQHLFERFYRGKSSADAGQAGSGLGLFVARGIARRHGGEVRRLVGDTFELELPLSRPR